MRAAMAARSICSRNAAGMVREGSRVRGFRLSGTGATTGQCTWPLARIFSILVVVDSGNKADGRGQGEVGHPHPGRLDDRGVGLAVMAAREIRRIGLIGVGKHGARDARHVGEEPDLELTAIARRDAGKLAAAAQELGARPYSDYRELIAGGAVDAVIAVVPSVLHPDIVAC